MRTFEFNRRCEGSPNYCISESGSVSRIGKPGYLKPTPMKRGGYLVVGLWHSGKGKLRPVHILVALAFRGPRPSPNHDAAHHDGNKLNNHWTNIFWKTRTENEADKVRHGTSNRGERNGQAKVTDSQAAEIATRARAGEKQADLAREFGLSGSAVSLISTGARRAAK